MGYDGGVVLVIAVVVMVMMVTVLVVHIPQIKEAAGRRRRDRGQSKILTLALLLVCRNT